MRRVSLSRWQLPREPDVVDPEGPSSTHLGPEWLVTNGLGGYACGTVSGIITRRFHGLLVAALPSPHGRTMMFNHLREQLRLPSGEVVQLGLQEPPLKSAVPLPLAHLDEFTLDYGLPVWRYEHAGYVIEKRVLMPHGQNTTHVIYRLLAGQGAIELVLEPFLHFRPHEGSLEQPLDAQYSLRASDDHYEVDSEGPLPPLRLAVSGHEGGFSIEGKRLQSVRYHIERSRGYDAMGDLYSPGFFRAMLSVERKVALTASTESWELASALSTEDVEQSERVRRLRLLEAADERAREGVGAELVLAADQFLIVPAGRLRDAARARATGDSVRTVIAGYHWFTDWGRDTMISLEGLTLCTGRHAEARYILRTFVHYVRDGLIPNMFPEGEDGGVYHTADATLWFFHAVHRYLEATGDRAALRRLLPTLLDIAERHHHGTRFGIHADPVDGLLTQGEEGYQLTWMDAKVGDLVVTPRRGKAIEINALYYNALRLLEGWVCEEQGDDAAVVFGQRAAAVYASFNQRFWYEAGGYLFDVIDGEDGDDPAFRPNQVLAFSLPHPVLERARWEPVLAKVKEQLLTPVGLRSLAPGHADYKPKYFGDLRARDLAYHQGTVWVWLLGPFIDAWLKVYPERRAEARRIVEAATRNLDEACLGSVSEIFDAEEPYTPRGCVAQAWSVAELLRAWIATSPNRLK